MNIFFNTRAIRKLPLLLVLLILSCKKDPPPSQPGLIERFLPEEAKAYIAFKPGSYWVYEDSASKARDSVWVDFLFYKRDTGWDVTKTEHLIYDLYTLRTTSSYDNYSYEYEINSLRSGPELRHSMTREKFKIGNYKGWTICFEYPIIPGHILYGGLNDVVTTTHYYDSITFNGTNYRGVSRVYNTENVPENLSKTISYFAKNAGIIKKINLDSDQTWTLVKCQIIK